MLVEVAPHWLNWNGDRRHFLPFGVRSCPDLALRKVGSYESHDAFHGFCGRALDAIKGWQPLIPELPLNASGAGVVLLAKDPTVAFPQCRILADAFHGNEPTSKPDDQEDIRQPMPVAIDRALDFVMRNTRHLMRVVGLNRIKLDEYPVEALREALVNAVAHHAA